MKTAILGIAHWHGQWYLDSLRALGCEVSAVWDNDVEAAERIGRSIGVPVFRDYREALDATAPALVVALPRPVEAKAVMEAALAHAIPIIAEKPLGLNSVDVKSIAEIADERGVCVSVMFPNRLSTIWQHALAPQAGSVIGAYFRINNGPYARYAASGCPWMLVASQAGGGALRNLGIHGADAVNALARGQEIEVLAASLSKSDPDLDIETYAVALVRFGDSTAVIDAGYNQPSDLASDFEWRISTERSYLVDRDDTLSVCEASGSRVVETVPMSRRYHLSVKTTLENLRTGAPPIASVWDCYRAARLVDAIYEHARVGWPAFSRGDQTALWR